jgi:hypothetical protein
VATGAGLGYTRIGSGTNVKIIVILFLVFIVGSLFSALYFLVRDKGQGTRTVKALTVRVALSVILFALLMLGIYTGLITDKLQ